MLTAQAISNFLYFIFFVTNSTTYSVSDNLKGSFLASPHTPHYQYFILAPKVVLSKCVPSSYVPMVSYLHNPPFCSCSSPSLQVSYQTLCCPSPLQPHYPSTEQEHLPQKVQATTLGLTSPHTCYDSAGLVSHCFCSPPRLLPSL